jgi:thioredoxin-dependent peroxiredoxin
MIQMALGCVHISMNGLATATFGGTLEVLGVSEVLQLISSSKKTGVLRFAPSNPNLELKLAVRDGRVVGVSGRSVPKLADVLLKFGVSPQIVGTLGAALTQGKNSQVLITLGREKLEQCLRFRLETGLLLLWQVQMGSFEFSHGEPPSTLETGLSLETVMLEVARRTDELSRVLLPDVTPETIYNIAERVGDFSSALRSLMPADWNLLNAIDGSSHLAAVAISAVLPWDELIRGINHLESIGFIEPSAAQRGLMRKYKRLQKTDLAPAFTLPSLDGSSVSLGSLRGKRTLLTFFRHAGCPFCNLRVHQLIEAYPRLERLGVQVIGVFGSSVEGLRARVGQQNPPFPLLADPDDAIHNLYGTGHSILGFMASFAPQGIAAFLEGSRLGITHGQTDGEATRMPADFLIGTDLRIEAALYGGHAFEHIGMKALEQWGQNGSLA